ncbi:MAG: flavodoxin family protein [Candidatus Pacebacteria bacterium]|nr:flavodoxin family protein [Candidatus Paceibacterota bacterium]
MKAIIICSSIHHQNTFKIAQSMAEVLNCSVAKTENVNPGELKEYDLIGFGSGIYLWKNHRGLIKLARNLTDMAGKSSFIFSTSGDKSHNIQKWHIALRDILKTKGFNILDEFNCLGWDTIGPLKLFGGVNRGRPNENDIENAKDFSRNILRLYTISHL